MLTKLFQWVPTLFCPLLYQFLLKSHEFKYFGNPGWCSLLDKNFKTLAYVITPQWVHLFKMTKHWDGFVSHCIQPFDVSVLLYGIDRFHTFLKIYSGIFHGIKERLKSITQMPLVVAAGPHCLFAELSRQNCQWSLNDLVDTASKG